MSNQTKGFKLLGSSRIWKMSREAESVAANYVICLLLLVTVYTLFTGSEVLVSKL